MKSAPNNFGKRQAIRSTWGYQKRFSDVPIKTVFLLGSVEKAVGMEPANVPVPKGQPPLALNEAINLESAKYGDIVQADFMDSYYNNTYKTMMGMRWLVEHCTRFRYAFFADDDMYISVKNLLKFLRHPTSYPEYWENQKKIDKLRAEKYYNDLLLASKFGKNQRKPEALKSLRHDNILRGDGSRPVKAWKNSPIDFDIDLDDDTPLYAGYVYFLPPYRHKLGNVTNLKFYKLKIFKKIEWKLC